MLKKFRLFLAAAVCTFLPACITVEQNITVRLDGSATLTVSYIVPRGFSGNRDVSEEIRKRYGYTYPTSVEEAQAFYQGMKGVTIEGITSSSQNGTTKITATLACPRIDGLVQGPLSYTLADLGGVKIFRATLALPPSSTMVPPLFSQQKPGGKPSVSDIIQKLMTSSQGSVGLKITAHFPTRVLESNGKVAGRTVEWAVPFIQPPSAVPTNPTLEVRFRATPSLWDRLRTLLGI